MTGRRKWWALGLTALVLTVVAALGGFDRVGPTEVNVGPGEPFDNGALTVTVKRAVILPEVPALNGEAIKPAPGSQLLAVVASLANDGTQPVPVSGQLELRGVEQAEDESVFLFSDWSQERFLGPGLATEFAFIWQVPVNAVRPGGKVTVRILKKRATEQGSGSPTWFNTTDYAQLDVPVSDQR